MKIAKKGTGVSTCSAPEALDVALCFGWIDGQRKALDDVHFLQKYTPRRARSRWSQINVGKVAQLIEGISEELRAAKGPDAATELAAVVEAFSLVGVGVHTQGELPDDVAVAGLFTQVIRECATNAVRHARAHHVWVAFGSHGDIVQTGQLPCDATEQNPVAPRRCVWYILAVSNDGAPCTKDIVPGGGLTGMRAACEALGAAFEKTAQARRPPAFLKSSLPA